MIEQRQEELDESHLSFAGEIRSRESAMEQLSEGLREMRARCMKKEQEVEFFVFYCLHLGLYRQVVDRTAEVLEREAEISKLEEQLAKVRAGVGKDEDVKDLQTELKELEAEKEENKRQMLSMRAAHRAEIEVLEQEKETVRFQLTKKVKTLEDELDKVQDETSTMAKHQGLLEDRLAKLNTQMDYETTISKLRLDVKRKEVLLHDAQNMLQQKEDNCAEKLLVRQLKIQVEEAGDEIAANIRARKNLELELADLTAQMEEVSAARAATESRFLEQVRENARLSSRVAEQEEEVCQLMKQYRASANSVETNMITLQDQAVSIQQLEMERDSARETSSELRVRVAELEAAAKEGVEARERERREGDLGRRLEVEETSRRRAETRLARLSEEVKLLCPQTPTLLNPGRGLLETHSTLCIDSMCDVFQLI